MNTNVVSLRSERDRQQLQMTCPSFPSDIDQYEDGTWECSSESLSALSKTFRSFGIELDPSWPFEVLYERFGFILKCASLVASADEQWIEKEYPLDLVEFVRALKHGKRSIVQATVADVLKSAPPQGKHPNLILIQ